MQRHLPLLPAKWRRLGLAATLATASLSAPALTTEAAPAAPAASPSPAKPELDRPRVVVLTDLSNEPDDEESLVRYLVYANEFDTEALIATTSIHLKDKIRPDLLHKAIKAYGEVLPNLRLHAPGYPTAQQLASVVRSGSPELGMKGVGDGKTTEGSKQIIAAGDRNDPRPLWVTVWGGANTLAQALHDVKKTRSPEELEKFVSKLRVYTISDQDDAGKWIRDNFPTLFYIVSPSVVGGGDYHLSTWSGISGDRWYKNGPMSDFHLVDNPWLEEHIRVGHGPLGALYPRVEYIMEGDTPSFLGLINNGLASHRDPGWGGWGGRYTLRQSYGETRPIWTNARDTVRAKDGSEHTTPQATIWRWREAYQHDFAARMDWCVAKRKQDANHNPIVVLNGDRTKRPIELKVKAGEKIELSAVGTHDPDGNRVTYRWFNYQEAGTHKPGVSLGSPSGPTTWFTAPAVKKPETLHVILEVVDDGVPRLYSYRRAVVTVEPSNDVVSDRRNH